MAELVESPLAVSSAAVMIHLESPMASSEFKGELAEPVVSSFHGAGQAASSPTVLSAAALCSMNAGFRNSAAEGLGGLEGAMHKRRPHRLHVTQVTRKATDFKVAMLFQPVEEGHERGSSPPATRSDDLQVLSTNACLTEKRGLV